MEKIPCVNVTTAKCYLVDSILKREESLDYGIECMDEMYLENISKTSSYMWIQNSGCDISKEICCKLDDFNTVLHLQQWTCEEDEDESCDKIIDCSIITIEEIKDDMNCRLPRTNVIDVTSGKHNIVTKSSPEPEPIAPEPEKPEPIKEYIPVPSGLQFYTRIINLQAIVPYTFNSGFNTILNVYVIDNTGEDITSGIEIDTTGSNVTLLAHVNLNNITAYVIGVN